MAGHSFDFTDKVSVVTGGTRGIGAALASGLLACGSRVAVFGRDRARLDEFVQAAEREHPGAILGVEADVADPEAVESAFATVAQRWGGVDHLVNNAGINIVGASIDYPIDSWRRILDVNITGVFLCTQQAARSMLERGGGSIVTIASMASFVGHPERAAYVASKSAVLGMIRSLAVEWGPLGIRINGVAPGYIRTDIVRDLIERGVLAPEVIENRTPLRRFGEPEDLVGGVLYLLSEQAGFATGQVLTLDGGWVANGYFK